LGHIEHPHHHKRLGTLDATLFIQESPFATEQLYLKGL